MLLSTGPIVGSPYLTRPKGTFRANCPGGMQGGLICVKIVFARKRQSKGVSYVKKSLEIFPFFLIFPIFPKTLEYMYDGPRTKSRREFREFRHIFRTNVYPRAFA